MDLNWISHLYFILEVHGIFFQCYFPHCTSKVRIIHKLQQSWIHYKKLCPFFNFKRYQGCWQEAWMLLEFLHLVLQTCLPKHKGSFVNLFSLSRRLYITNLHHILVTSFTVESYFKFALQLRSILYEFVGPQGHVHHFTLYTVHGKDSSYPHPEWPWPSPTLSSKEMACFHCFSHSKCTSAIQCRGDELINAFS